MEPDRETSRVVAAVTRWIVVLAAVAIGLAFLAYGSEVGVGAIAGAGLAIVVWVAAAAIGRRIVAAGPRGRIAWAFAFVVESALVMGAAALLLWLTDPTGMAIGFSALIAGAVCGAIEGGARQRAHGA